MLWIYGTQKVWDPLLDQGCKDLYEQCLLGAAQKT